MVVTGCQYLLGSLPVVLVGSGDEHFENPSVGVYEEVTLTAFDLLVSIIANIVLPGLPPFSVVLTD